jgi:antitoxin component YwqK of YwqJK toxin-antitoxin module
MKYLVFLLPLLVLASCSPPEVPEEVPEEKIVYRQGIPYAINSDKPFTGIIVSFYDNGQREMRGNYKDGKLDGLHEQFSINGQVTVRGNYRHGLRDGLYEEFDEYGELMLRENWEDGVTID